MRGLARVLVMVGGGGVAASALLPWVTVEGPSLRLDFLDAVTSAAGRTVAGTETAAWPGVVGVGVVVGLLGLLNLARRALALLGLLTVVAGGALVYYAANAVDIETSGRSGVERALGEAALSSAPDVGAFVLLASGLVVVLGSLLR